MRASSPYNFWNCSRKSCASRGARWADGTSLAVSFSVMMGNERQRSFRDDGIVCRRRSLNKTQEARLHYMQCPLRIMRKFSTHAVNFRQKTAAATVAHVTLPAQSAPTDSSARPRLTLRHNYLSFIEDTALTLG